MTASPRPCLVVVTLLLACTSTSGPSPLVEPAGTILAVSNAPETVTAMVVGTPADSAWSLLQIPGLYLRAYSAKLTAHGDAVVTMLNEIATNRYTLARITLASSMVEALRNVPPEAYPEGVAPGSPDGSIVFKATNWPGYPEEWLLRFDPTTDEVSPVVSQPVPALSHIDRSPDGRFLFGLQTKDDRTTLLIAVDMRATPIRIDTLRSIPSPSVFAPSAVPDGSGVIYSWNVDGTEQGWRTERLDLHDRANPTTIPIDGYFPVYSPDGRWIAYTEAITQQAWLYRVADGHRRRAFRSDAPPLLIRDWK